jgi:uncharacterized protein (TIGR03579 family)
LTTQAGSLNEKDMYKNFWYADWSFPIFVALLSAGIFAGTHMYYVYKIGAFNDVAVVAMLEAGIQGAGYGAAAAFGASFLFARVLEGALVGSLQTGIGIGVPAVLLASGITAPVENFVLSLITGALLGIIVGYAILGIRKFTVGQSNSTFGADIMMGAGNASGRFLGPLIVISAANASIPIGVGSTIGAAVFYIWKKPVAGGAILGAMIFGAIFPISLE